MSQQQQEQSSFTEAAVSTEAGKKLPQAYAQPFSNFLS
jgi:hypothetical protein